MGRGESKCSKKGIRSDGPGESERDSCGAGEADERREGGNKGK